MEFEPENLEAPPGFEPGMGGFADFFGSWMLLSRLACWYRVIGGFSRCQGAIGRKSDVSFLSARSHCSRHKRSILFGTVLVPGHHRKGGIDNSRQISEQYNRHESLPSRATYPSRMAAFTFARSPRSNVTSVSCPTAANAAR